MADTPDAKPKAETPPVLRDEVRPGRFAMDDEDLGWLEIQSERVKPAPKPGK
jgi:hypothetical protein